MPTHGSVAKSVRKRKEANPTFYCPNHKCLWRTYNAFEGLWYPCGNHGLVHPDVPKEKIRSNG